MKQAIRWLLLALLASLGTAAPALATDAPVVTDAWARATPPGSDVAAVYLTLHGGAAADRLAGASTPRATMTHLHSMEYAGGMATMRTVDGVEVPAGKTVTLAPHGLHLMLMGVAKPLVTGERFPVTLHFVKGGDRLIEVQVRPATAPDPPSASHR